MISLNTTCQPRAAASGDRKALAQADHFPRARLTRQSERGSGQSGNTARTTKEPKS